MAHDVVGRVVGNLAGGGVGVYHGAAVDAGDVAGVAGAIVLVEDEIPYIPALGPVVEIGDHAAREAQGGGPCATDAPLGVEEVLVGEGVVDDADVIKMVAGVPMVSGAPDVFRGLGVVVGGLHAFVNEAAVVVPDHDFHIAQARVFQRGAEVFFHEILLLVGAEEVRFPCLRRLSFVLHGEAPDRDALGLVSLDVFHEIIGPGLVIFGLEFAAVEHLAIRLHPAGRAPGGGVELELVVRSLHRALNEGDAVFFIMLDGEILQLLVTRRIVVGVHVIGVIAAMDGGAAKGIAIPGHRVEAGLEELLLHILGQLAEDGCRRIGKRPAEADDGLEGLLVVNDDGRDVLVRLIELREREETVVGDQLRGRRCGRGERIRRSRCGGGGRRGDIDARFLVIRARRGGVGGISRVGCSEKAARRGGKQQGPQACADDSGDDCGDGCLHWGDTDCSASPKAETRRIKLPCTPLPRRSSIFRRVPQFFHKRTMVAVIDIRNAPRFIHLRQDHSDALFLGRPDERHLDLRRILLHRGRAHMERSGIILRIGKDIPLDVRRIALRHRLVQHPHDPRVKLRRQPALARLHLLRIEAHIVLEVILVKRLHSLRGIGPGAIRRAGSDREKREQEGKVESQQFHGKFLVKQPQAHSAKTCRTMQAETFLPAKGNQSVHRFFTSHPTNQRITSRPFAFLFVE